jgi:iron(III) transport system permease protein
MNFMNLMVLLALVPAIIIVGLLLGSVWISGRESIVDSTLTLRHYLELYADPFAYLSFLNTLGFSFFTLLAAFIFGVPIAWIAERSDIRGKSIIYTFMTVGIFVPSFFTAMGWLFLLHPKIGMVNVWLKTMLGLSAAPFNIINIPGMGIIQGLGLASVVFVLTAASLRSMDSRLEESAEMSGAGCVTLLWFVPLPLAWPGLLASGLYVFTIGIGAFDVPLVLGLSNRIYTFSTYLYVMTNPQEGVPAYGLVAAYASFMVVLALLLSWWYSRVLVKSRKYQVVSGKGYQPKLVPMGKWKYAAWGFVLFYFLLSKAMPLIMMTWASLIPYFQPFSMAALQNVSLANYTTLNWSLLTRGLTNSVILMLLVPVIALVISLIFSWVVLRWRNRCRLAFDFIAFLPHAVPSTIFAFIALVFVQFVPLGPVDLYGTLIIVIIVMALGSLSFGSRITNSALIQIHHELEEAAMMSGASALDAMRLVIFPLLRPALVFGWLWIALLTFRELTIPTILFSPENITYSVAVWSLWFGGALNKAAAASVIMILLLLPLVILYWHYTQKVRIGTSET